MTKSPALKALLTKYKGGQVDTPEEVPPINPPEAEKVLEEQTEPEVNGEIEPPTALEIAAANKQAAQIAAQDAARAKAAEARTNNPPKRTRRTVAIADAELAAANAEIEDLKAQLVELDDGGCSDELATEMASLKKENESLAEEVGGLVAGADELINQNAALKAQLDSGGSTSGIIVADSTRFEDLAEELKRRGASVTVTF